MYCCAMLRRTLDGSAGFVPDALWQIYHQGHRWVISPNYDRPAITRHVLAFTPSGGWAAGLVINYDVDRQALLADTPDWLDDVFASLRISNLDGLCNMLASRFQGAVALRISDDAVEVDMRAFDKGLGVLPVEGFEYEVSKPAHSAQDATKAACEVVRGALEKAGMPEPDIAFALAPSFYAQLLAFFNRLYEEYELMQAAAGEPEVEKGAEDEEATSDKEGPERGSE